MTKSILIIEDERGAEVMITGPDCRVRYEFDDLDEAIDALPNLEETHS
ncbi:hypothetical protein V7974_004681 [Vibrio parahaemolyticus]